MATNTPKGIAGRQTFDETTDRYGGYISEGWLDRRRRMYAHAGEVPPPIVVDDKGIAREARDDTRGRDSLASCWWCGHTHPKAKQCNDCYMGCELAEGWPDVE